MPGSGTSSVTSAGLRTERRVLQACLCRCNDQQNVTKMMRRHASIPSSVTVCTVTRNGMRGRPVRDVRGLAGQQRGAAARHVGRARAQQALGLGPPARRHRRARRAQLAAARAHADRVHLAGAAARRRPRWPRPARRLGEQVWERALRLQRVPEWVNYSRLSANFLAVYGAAQVR